ncbi:MAG TPA: cytochrome c biogenesis protein CcsA [Planctomycetota bacterium]|nr:cytochrome c biogenesis protein CcsA [Planctomycetota bacterium]
MKKTVVLALIVALSPLFASETPAFAPPLNFTSMERLAVQEGGRKKVFQTLAQDYIEQLIGRSVFGSKPSLIEKSSGRKFDSMEWYLSIWLFPEHWEHQPLVLVSYRPLRIALGLNDAEKYFSVQELRSSPRFAELISQGMELRHDQRDKELTDLQKEAEIVAQRLEVFDQIVSTENWLSIVPHPSKEDGTWLSLPKWETRFADKEAVPYYARANYDVVAAQWAALKHAYRTRNAESFAASTAQLDSALRDLSPKVYPAESALTRELTYNKSRPFGLAWLLYLPAALLGLLALKYRAKAIYAAALLFFLGGLSMHIYGFALRCLIAGRPPVSNMYESVVWVGFGAVVFGLIFELIYRKRFYMVCGAAAGFVCLVLMDEMPVLMGNVNAPGFESQIRPLVPVLRDNFWLTIHVLTITLGYSAFMLAWFLGHVTLFSHLFRPARSAEHRELHNFVYYALQIGVLLLATGTILGGVWAYYSWGRFWGWDPKETWAFIALMCYLIVLHGRFSGWWSNFGLSVGAVVCFQAVVMAWYGVNFVLGNGLHAYGTGAGGEAYVITGVAVDAIFTAAAIIRRKTFRAANASEKVAPVLIERKA